MSKRSTRIYTYELTVQISIVSNEALVDDELGRILDILDTKLAAETTEPSDIEVKFIQVEDIEDYRDCGAGDLD